MECSAGRTSKSESSSRPGDSLISVSPKHRGGGYGALVAFPIHDQHYLCELAVQDFQPELKKSKIWFCSMGSGQMIADPFLALMREVFWPNDPPTLQDATLAATWTLDHAISVNPGGVNGPARVAVLERVSGSLRARELTDDDLQEHRQNIEEAKGRLREYRSQQQATAPDIPDVPRA